MPTAAELAAKITVGDENLDRLHNAVNDPPGTWTTADGTVVDNLRKQLQDVSENETFSVTETLSGDGSTTEFTLTRSPASKNNTNVFINGVYQQKDTYAIAGSTLSFNEAPYVGTDNVEVVIGVSGTNINVSASEVDLASGESVQVALTRAPNSFASRSLAADWIEAHGDDLPDGSEVSWGDFAVYKSTGATAIADMQGWLPVWKAYPDHHAENTIPGTTDMSTALSAWWQSDNTAGKAMLSDSTYYSSTILGVAGAGDIDANGATIALDRTDATTNYQMDVGSTTVRNLVVTYATGKYAHRTIGVGESGLTIKCKVISVDETDKETDVNDAGIVIYGDEGASKECYTENIGRGLACSDFVYAPKITDFTAKGYVKGIQTTRNHRAVISGVYLSDPSSLSSTDPGDNGIGGSLLDASVLERFTVDGCGEHGVYFSIEPSNLARLNFDAETVPFSRGETLTGGTSGATGVIRVISKDGPSNGYLVLSSLSGTFQDNEAITDGSGGAADADGTTSDYRPQNIVVRDGNILRSGQTGFKMRDADAPTVSNVQVSDAAYNNKTGSNESCFDFENCDRLRLISSTGNGNEKTPAGYDIINLTNCGEYLIQDVTGRAPSNAFLHIEEGDGPSYGELVRPVMLDAGSVPLIKITATSGAFLANNTTDGVVKGGTGDVAEINISGSATLADCRIEGDFDTTATGDWITNTAGGGNVTVVNNGKIEEGTWTPVFEPQTGSFTTQTPDTGFQSGQYHVTEDRFCVFRGAYRTDAIDATGASGAAFLGGLPVTAANGDTFNEAVTVRADDWSSNVPIVAYIRDNTDNIVLETLVTAGSGTVTTCQVTDLGTGGNSNSVFVAGRYKV